MAKKFSLLFLFLCSSAVPSLMRVSALEAKSNNTTSTLVENKEVELEDEGWIATHMNGIFQCFSVLKPRDS